MTEREPAKADLMGLSVLEWWKVAIFIFLRVSVGTLFRVLLEEPKKWLDEYLCDNTRVDAEIAIYSCPHDPRMYCVCRNSGP